jgi:hypothetical protein
MKIIPIATTAQNVFCMCGLASEPGYLPLLLRVYGGEAAALLHFYSKLLLQFQRRRRALTRVRFAGQPDSLLP